MISHADSQLVQQLDESDYCDTDLIEVKIPLHLPYMQSQSEYERYDGSAEHDGVQYNYVKRRLSNDTLSILCIPNKEKTTLVKQTRNLLTEINDFPAGKKSKPAQIKKSGISADFFPAMDEYNLASAIEASGVPACVLYQSPLSSYLPVAERPPQQA